MKPEVGHAEVGGKDQEDYAAQWLRRAEKAEARVERLEAALRKYGSHHSACYQPTVHYASGSSYTPGKIGVCECGLEAALAVNEEKGRGG